MTRHVTRSFAAPIHRCKLARSLVCGLGLLLGLSGVLGRLTAQQGSAAPVSISEASGVHSAGQSSRSTPALHPSYPRYTIQRRDTLKLSFPIAPEFDQTLSVQPDGYINPQGVPSMHVVGLTVDQVKALIVSEYSKILHDPIVSIDVKDFATPFFTVNGQVGKPGQYELKEDLTVNEAIAVAGGMQSSASGHVFIFRRVSPDQFAVTPVDMKSLFKGKRPTELPLVKAGDMILVPESGIATFKKYVPYSVGATYFPGV